MKITRDSAGKPVRLRLDGPEGRLLGAAWPLVSGGWQAEVIDQHDGATLSWAGAPSYRTAMCRVQGEVLRIYRERWTARTGGAVATVARDSYLGLEDYPRPDRWQVCLLGSGSVLCDLDQRTAERVARGLNAVAPGDMPAELAALRSGLRAA